MIKSKIDYKLYLEKDRVKLNKKRRFPVPFIGDEVWKFQRLMRKTEYYNNCKGKIYKPYLYLLKYRYRKMSIKLGFTIPINTFGYGLSIAHYGTIIINDKVKIGNNCRIHCCVNIGGTGNDVPKLGDNCYIGPGAKLFGSINIGNNVSIGANSVVNKSFGDNVTIVGVPAKVIKNK